MIRGNAAIPLFIHLFHVAPGYFQTEVLVGGGGKEFTREVTGPLYALGSLSLRVPVQPQVVVDTSEGKQVGAHGLDELTDVTQGVAGRAGCGGGLLQPLGFGAVLWP